MKYSLVNFCEFDKYAVKSYCAIHGTDEALNLGDITKVNETEIEPFNMICGGSPCQDFSLAGKQNGAVWKCKKCGHSYNPLQVHYTKRDTCSICGSKDIDKTRSSLLVEWLRMIRGVRPMWGIYENVKNIVGKRFKETTFRLFEEELHEYGYNTYWSVLNAKYYGIPQNRERVYLILIQKEVDNGSFHFPEQLKTFRCLMDILEDTVDEKYYLPERKVHKLIEDLEERKALLFEPDEKTLQSWRENNLKKVGQVNEGGEYEQSGRVYMPCGCSPTITASGGGNQQPKILQVGRTAHTYGATGVVYSPLGIAGTHTASHEQGAIIEKASGAIRGRYEENGNSNQELEMGEKDSRHTLTTVQKDNIILVRQKTVKGYEECMESGVANLGYPTTEKRGRVQDQGETCPTLTTSSGVCRLESLIRIRRLTPRECFRLMGFSDVDFSKVKDAGISDCQLYKQAGNSIVVDVLYYIFLELYCAMPYLFDDVKLSSFFSGIGAFEKALERLEQQVNN
jgi:DNA (cytosine-5)-methyltransferase 1